MDQSDTLFDALPSSELWERHEPSFEPPKDGKQTITTLPIEILIQIVEMTHRVEPKAGVTLLQVCRQFFIAGQRALYTNIYIGPFELDPIPAHDATLEQLKECITRKSGPLGALHLNPSYIPNVRKIVIYGNPPWKLFKAFVTMVQYVLKSAGGLRSLSLNLAPQQGPNGEDADYDSFEALDSLVDLKIRDVPHPRIQPLVFSPRLKTLNLLQSHSPGSSTPFLQEINKPTSVQNLEWSFNCVGDTATDYQRSEACLRLSRLFPMLTNLTIKIVGHPPVYINTLIARGNFPNLEHLTLHLTFMENETFLMDEKLWERLTLRAEENLKNLKSWALYSQEKRSGYWWWPSPTMIYLWTRPSAVGDGTT